MFPKFILTVLFCLVVGNSCYKVENGVRHQERDVFDEFQKLLQTIANIVEAGINTANKGFREILGKISEIGEILITETGEAIISTVNIAVNAIDKLVYDAEMLGFDVIDCLGDNFSAMKAIPQNAISDCRVCLKKNMDDCENIIENAFNNIRSVIDVEKISNEFKKCSGLTALVCRLRVVAETGLKVAALPAKIAVETAKGTALLVEKQAEVIVCKTYAVADAVKESAQLSDTIVKCIQEKMQGI